MAWAEPWAVPLITIGRARPRSTSTIPELSAENVLRFMVLRRRQPVVDLLLPARGARVGALGARRDHLGDVRGPQRAPGSRCATYDYDRVQRIGVSGVLDWVKMRSHLFRGVTFGTMLRDEAYHFLRLGTHLERADNTARILDTKYHILLPSAQDVGGAVDYYQWQSLLRRCPGFEAYRKIYSDVITPRRVAELLILRDDMPRSLHACLELINETLELLCDERNWELERHGGRAARAPAVRQDRGHHALRAARVPDRLPRADHALDDEISASLPRARRTDATSATTAARRSARIIGLASRPSP